MAFHGLLFVVAGVLAAIFVLKISFQSAGPSDARDDYMDGPIKVATIAAVFWGIAGFVVGDVIAWQLAFPALNLDLPWTSFGRLRPLHTSAVIFAFGSLGQSCAPIPSCVSSLSRSPSTACRAFRGGQS